MRAVALALLLLAGCDDIPQARTEAEIKELARAVVADENRQLRVRIDDLETRLDTTETEIQGVRALGLENSRNADSFAATFNSNVKKDNEASVRAMTARGACGQEVYYDAYNTPRSRNKECTLKDLR